LTNLEKLFTINSEFKIWSAMITQSNCDRKFKRENCHRLKAIQTEAIMKHVGAHLKEWKTFKCF